MSLEALLQYWSSQKLSKAPGVSEQELEAFEKRNKIRIHDEFRHYLSTVNGMIEADNCDSNLFAFWSLEKIKPVADECPELESTKGYESYFIFADYMIWSWAYAINLDANS